MCLVRNIGCELSLINKAWIDVKIVDWDIVRGSCTNWVRRVRPKTNDAGTQGLMDLFREVFRNYGVPVEISSD